MSAVLDQLRSEGYNVDDGDVAHLSLARYAHINPYGKYRFDAAHQLCSYSNATRGNIEVAINLV